MNICNDRVTSDTTVPVSVPPEHSRTIRGSLEKGRHMKVKCITFRTNDQKNSTCFARAITNDDKEQTRDS
jgi:hypothetical protein